MTLKEQRKNGITLIINNQVLITQKASNDDVRFIQTVASFHDQWLKDGKPLSNQGF